MQRNGVVVRELRPRTMEGVVMYEAHTVYPRHNEGLAEVVARLCIACFACGARPGTHFLREDWWVCGLHGAPTPDQEEKGIHQAG